MLFMGLRMIDIIVAFATPSKQIEIPLCVEKTCNVAVAIRRSGILEQFPEIDLPNSVVGIYNKRVNLDAALRDKDRIEIYRPLTIDPKEARRLRAQRYKK